LSMVVLSRAFVIEGTPRRSDGTQPCARRFLLGAFLETLKVVNFL
jgi:hypothetical protein